MTGIVIIFTGIALTIKNNNINNYKLLHGLNTFLTLLRLNYLWLNKKDIMFL